MRRAGALAKGGSKAAKKGVPKPPTRKPPTRKPPVKKQPVKKGSGGGASPVGDASVAGAAGIASEVSAPSGFSGGSAPSGFSGGGAADGSPIGTSFPSMNINIQVSGQDMAATSGAFGKGAAPVAESDAGEMATATGSKKPKLKKKKPKTPAKTKTKTPVKKGRKSKFTLEGSPVGNDSRFEWSLIAFLLVAILLVL